MNDMDAFICVLKVHTCMQPYMFWKNSVTFTFKIGKCQI